MCNCRFFFNGNKPGEASRSPYCHVCSPTHFILSFIYPPLTSIPSISASDVAVILNNVDRTKTSKRNFILFVSSPLSLCDLQSSDWGTRDAARAM